MISKVANFKEEGLVTPEGWEGEKEILKICWSMQGIEPGSAGWNAKVPTTTLSRHLVLGEGDFKKVSCIKNLQFHQSFITPDSDDQYWA